MPLEPNLHEEDKRVVVVRLVGLAVDDLVQGYAWGNRSQNVHERGFGNVGGRKSREGRQPGRHNGHLSPRHCQDPQPVLG